MKESVLSLKKNKNKNSIGSPTFKLPARLKNLL